MPTIRRFSVFAVLVLFGAVALSGCATRGFVRIQVDEFEPRVAEVEGSSRENAERIDAVDQRAQNGINQANGAAATADQKAVAAGDSATEADRKAEAAQQSANNAGTMARSNQNRIENLSDAYAEDESHTISFRYNSAALSDEASATLDGVAGDVANASNYRVEVQGYTDSSGDPSYNVGLSQRRATAVFRYLVSKDVPLHRIAMIGLGEENPVADNSTRAGREENRRVEVRVLRTTFGSR